MLSLFKNKFFLAYIFLFFLSGWILWRNQYPLEDIFTGALMLGIFFPLIAYFLSRTSQPLFTDRPAQHAEPWILTGIMLYITVWLTWGTGWVNLHLPGFISNSQPAVYLFTIFKKLIAFVLLPCAVYHYRYGFSGKNFDGDILSGR